MHLILFVYLIALVSISSFSYYYNPLKRYHDQGRSLRKHLIGCCLQSLRVHVIIMAGNTAAGRIEAGATAEGSHPDQ